MGGEDIGARAREAMGSAMPGVPQAQVAERIGLTPDAFSRALNGKRAFSAIELARLADLLGADIHWLITGEPDPNRIAFVARHRFDFGTGVRDVPGRENDTAILDNVKLAYLQAGQLDPSAPVPVTAPKLRAELGSDFVRPFADRVEARLNVDVVRVAGLSTSYCFTLQGRHVIVVPAVGNWFRENWDIAHELAHLAEGHLQDMAATSGQEAAANAFAAELLLPAEEIRRVEWLHLTEADLAQRVWDYGVSTDALSRRVTALRLPAADLVGVWARQPTQRLLRRYWHNSGAHGEDEITKRMTDAATRRFPLELREAHLRRIASGDLGKATLAWMLDVPADTLDVDAPRPADSPDIDALAAALGLSPST